MIEHDLIIRNGLVVDGSGGAPFKGDIAIRDGRISAVGEVDGTAPEEIDATGRMVTPGFVDIHTHYDGQSIWSQHLTPSSAHGVTSVVMGNCGVGFAPCRPEDRELLIRVMEGVEDIPEVVMAEGLPWDWETFPEFLDALEARQRDIDVGAYLPHSPLRVYAMGERGARRESAREEDLAAMRRLTREAVEAGALGFATSRLSIHKTADGDAIPSFQAPIEELKAITSGLSDANAGVFQMVMDAPNENLSWDDEIGRLIDVTTSCGRPSTFTLATTNSGPAFWDDMLERVSAANAGGSRITAQLLPRPIGLLSGLELSINPFALCPSWAKIADLPLDEKVAAMRDPEVRAALLSETPGEGHPLIMRGRMWNWMFPLGDPPNYAPNLDESISAQAAARGVAPEEWAYDYFLETDGKGQFYGAVANFHQGRLDELYDLLRHPDCVPGLGDGGAHYGAICDASYTTFVLTYWARDREGSRIPVETAVHMMTRKPAMTIGLADRGLLKTGYKADVNVIDFERLHLPAPHIVRDLPANGRRIDQNATGYDATIVSGHVIRRFDKATGALPGKLIRGARADAA